jgi:hypothetical protein
MGVGHYYFPANGVPPPWQEVIAVGIFQFHYQLESTILGSSAATKY